MCGAKRFFLVWLPVVVVSVGLLEVRASADTYVDEDWESYNIGDFPSAGGWTLGGDRDTYERYAGNHVVAKPGGSGKCMMVTNPFNGWGMHLQQQLPWTFSGDEVVRVEVEYMYPGSSSHNVGNSVDFKIYEWSQPASIAVHLDTNTDPGYDGLGINATNGAAMEFVSTYGQFDQWVQMVAEINVATLTYDLWADGTLVGNDLGLNPGADLFSSDTFQIGKGFFQSGPGYYDNVRVQIVPEPGTVTLACVGGLVALLGLGMNRRQRVRRSIGWARHRVAGTTQ